MRGELRCRNFSYAVKDRELKVLFVGRITGLKGGAIMLDALVPAAASLGRSLKVTFVGDGSDRVQWAEVAVYTRRRERHIEFTGWLNSASLDQLMLDSGLLVVPRTWPEPFGLVGPEAGFRELPAAAFALGGIPEWLSDGINGYLAHYDPPTAAGLARAISNACAIRPDYAAWKRREGVVQTLQPRRPCRCSAGVFEGVIGVNAAALAQT